MPGKTLCESNMPPFNTLDYRGDNKVINAKLVNNLVTDALQQSLQYTDLYDTLSLTNYDIN